MSMDKKSQVVLVLGLAITIIFLIFSIYLAGIVFILVITLFISLQIMQDSEHRPDISADLSEDARAIIIKNSGNAPALNIHVALVPLNKEYDVPSLAVDESHTYPLDSMIQEVKVVVTYGNEVQNIFSKTFPLSSSNAGYDPFQPMIPLFKWK